MITEATMGGSAGSWVQVAALADLPVKGTAPIHVGEHFLMLVRVDEVITAAQRLCPHEFADLSQGRVDGTHIFCPRHRACFDVARGTSGGGWNLPALKLYPVEIREGQIWLDLAAVDADPPVRVRRIEPSRR